MLFSAQFRTTSHFDREYLRNGTRYRQSENCQSAVCCVLQADNSVGAAHRCRTRPVQQPDLVSDGRRPRVAVRSNELRRQLRSSRDVTQSLTDRTAAHPGRRTLLSSSRLASARQQPYLGLCAAARVSFKAVLHRIISRRSFLQDYLQNHSARPGPVRYGPLIFRLGQARFADFAPAGFMRVM